MTPDPQKVEILESVAGDATPVVLAVGEGVSADEAAEKLKSEHPELEGDPHLMYNEYIVYDVAQIVIRYLVRVRFSFKSVLDAPPVSSSSSGSSAASSPTDESEASSDDPA